MARINKKHFVLFNNGGIISATTPKGWARANQTLFDGYDFSDSDNTPTVIEIETYLISIGWQIVTNEEIVILYPYSKI
jgi:hypothetical protein